MDKLRKQSATEPKQKYGSSVTVYFPDTDARTYATRAIEYDVVEDAHKAAAETALLRGVESRVQAAKLALDAKIVAHRAAADSPPDPAELADTLFRAAARMPEDPSVTLQSNPISKLFQTRDQSLGSSRCKLIFEHQFGNKLYSTKLTIFVDSVPIGEFTTPQVHPNRRVAKLAAAELAVQGGMLGAMRAADFIKRKEDLPIDADKELQEALANAVSFICEQANLCLGHATCVKFTNASVKGSASTLILHILMTESGTYYSWRSFI